MCAHDYTFLNAPFYDEVAEKQENSCGFYTPYNDSDMKSYHCMTAVMLQCAKFFDYLRENDCYDNTRIIITSDHGWGANYERFRNMKNPGAYAYFNPILLVKDFGEVGQLKTSDEFMTNADTIFFAKEGLGLADSNPFTGKKFEQNKKDGVYGHYEYDWRANMMLDRTQFEFSQTWCVKDNIFDDANWKRLYPQEEK